MEFVAAPHRRRYRGHNVQQASRTRWIDADSHCGRGGRGIGDEAIAPAADFVAEHPEPPCALHSDGPFGHDTSFGSVRIRDGRHLDHVAAFGNRDLESRVVQIARLSPMDQCRHRLEHLATGQHNSLTRAERDPQQIHGCDQPIRIALGVTRNGIAVHVRIQHRRMPHGNGQRS